jgi:hypothetical protein
MYKNYKEIQQTIHEECNGIKNAWGGIGHVTKRYKICNYAILATHQHMEGSIVEIGVARGDCIKLISENVPENFKIHLFDTFEGLPEATKEDEQSKNTKGLSCFSLDYVKKFIGEKKNLTYHKGLIEETYKNLPDDIILCHIDCDLYYGIYTSLKHVIPKLKKGGIIIIDDYNNITFKGVDKAIIDINKELNTDIKSLYHDKTIPNVQAIYCKKI